jgi:hypothetical protein
MSNKNDAKSKIAAAGSIPGRDVQAEQPAKPAADEKTGQGKTPEIGRRDSGEGEQNGPPHHDEPGRGSSIHGKHQDAKGGPMGANQGGAPRGGSRVEPSHVHDQRKQDKRQTRETGNG